MDGISLTEKILEKGLDFGKIAKQLEIDKMTFFRKLANTESFTIREAEMLKDILELTNLEALKIFLDQ